MDSSPESPKIHLVNLPPEQLSREQRSIVHAFTVVYEQLNQLAYRRAKLGTESPSTELLMQIEKALIERDNLEDEHAPIGILVEPIYRKGIAIELMITIASLRAGTFQAQTWLSSSCEIEL